jgi:hypothetical protein
MKSNSETLYRYESQCDQIGIDKSQPLAALENFLEDHGKNSGLDLMAFILRFQSEVEQLSENEMRIIQQLSFLAESFRIEE